MQQVSRLQTQIADMQQQLHTLQAKAEEATRAVTDAQEALDRASRVMVDEQARSMDVDAAAGADFTVGNEHTRCGPPHIQLVYTHEHVMASMHRMVQQADDLGVDPAILQFLDGELRHGLRQGCLQPQDTPPTQIDPSATDTPADPSQASTQPMAQPVQ